MPSIEVRRAKLRRFFEKIHDSCALHKCPLEKIVAWLALIEFVIILVLVTFAMIIFFLYTDPAGRGGFVDVTETLVYEDIFRYRWHQSWEFENPIDWEVGDRIHINETRNKLFHECSSFPDDENETSQIGDPGDYVKDVVGHPNDSGYNATLDSLVRLFLAAFLIIYFSSPLTLLSIWWKEQRTNIVITMMLFRTVVPCILTYITFKLYQPLMCAADTIYFGAIFSLRHFMGGLTVTSYVATIFTYPLMGLYCVDHLIKVERRKKAQQLNRDDKKSVATSQKKSKAKNKEGANEPVPEHRYLSAARLAELMANQRETNSKQLETKSSTHTSLKDAEDK